MKTTLEPVTGAVAAAKVAAFIMVEIVHAGTTASRDVWMLQHMHSSKPEHNAAEEHCSSESQGKMREACRPLSLCCDGLHASEIRRCSIVLGVRPRSPQPTAQYLWHVGGA